MLNAINRLNKLKEAMFMERKTPCSFNKTVYEKDKDSFNCQGSTNVYHCIPNERNRSGEICIQSVWVQPNYCPEYNTGAHTLDTVPCNVSIGSCPDVLFLSNEVYKYPACLNKTFIGDEKISREDILPEPLPWIFVGVGILFVILLLIVSCVVHQRRRKRQPKNGGEEMHLIDSRWGSGKRSTAKQVYVDVTNSSPIMISDPLKFDVTEHHEPIIVDMSLSIGISKSGKKDLADKSHMLFENMSSSNTCKQAFIIFLIDKDRKSITKFVKSLKKKTKFIDMSKSLTKGDRTQILSSQLLIFCPKIGFSQVEQLALKGKDHSLGYPEICALFCRCGHFQTVGLKTFCNQPLRYLKSYLENMHRSNNKKTFLMLVYMSLNKMKINVDDDKNDKLFELLESCNCDTFGEETKCKTEQMESTGTETTEETSNIQQGLSSKDKPKKHCKSKEDIPSFIPKEFVIKEASIYRLQHDVIKRMTLIVYGTHHFDKLLELSKPEELKTWVKEEQTRIFDLQGDIEPVLEIDREQWRQLQAKLSY
ncbi:uncharacterized protein [Magallana gigas]|uniref:uncharacterized protein isoform X8 n=1 Tax=Magallana gigas TaxID=29159 RepID=UPI00333F61C0